MIPICDLRKQHAALQDELSAAFNDVVLRGRYILGPNVKSLEGEVAEFLGCEHAVGVNSGSDALHLALRACDVGPGDEVVTTPFTFIATTEAIGLVGATPVFVDIDETTYNLDVRQLADAITPRTKAIIPVHLFGQPCDMDSIMAVAKEHGLRVIEDCAQALGARYHGRLVGSIGDLGCLSFFPSKNLGCLGDGGMVVSNDDALAKRVEMLRRHGGAVKYHHTELGVNSRLDELQAALLRVKLPHLNRWNARRRQIAYRYNRELALHPLLKRPTELQTNDVVVPVQDGDNTANECVYAQYTLLSPQRDSLVEQLKECEIGTGIYYPVPLHLQSVHADLGYRAGQFPVAESVAARCVSLPMYPELTDDDQEFVAATLDRLTDDASWRKAG